MGSAQNKESRVSSIRSCRRRRLWFAAALMLALAASTAVSGPVVSAHRAVGQPTAQVDQAAGRPTPGPAVVPATPQPPIAPTTLASSCPPQSVSAPADWPITMCDTFDNNANGWDEGVVNRDEGRIVRTIADGMYTWDMDVSKFLYISGSSPLGDLIDFYAAVDVRVVGDPPEGLYYALGFRRQDVLAFYMFQVSNRGMFRLWRWIGDSTFPIDWTPSPAVRPNDWNRIAVKAVGPQLTFYVNDEQVAEFTDNVIMAGRVQLVFALQGAGHAAVQFDNFEVRAAPYSGIPTFAPLPTVGPAPVPTDTPLPSTPPPPPKASTAGCPPVSAVAPADWPLLMCDTFDDNASGWATKPVCDEKACNTWAVANGVFAWNINAYESHQAQRLVPLAPVGDFYAAVDAYVTGATVEDGEYALKFRVTDPRNYYSYDISFDELLGVFRSLEGESTNILVERIPPGIFHFDDWNRLGVMAVGPSIILYLNDQEIGRLSDPFVPAGQLMLSIVVLKPGHFVAYFDNFEVRQAPAGAQPPPRPRKVVTSCPGSPAVAPDDWPVFVCETFDENAYSWWVGQRSLLVGQGQSLHKIDGGAYVWAFKVKEGIDTWEKPELPPVSDFFASVQAKRVSLNEGSGYGLVFRMKDSENYFVFRINDRQQFEVLIRVNAFSRRLIEPTQSSAIRPGEVNTVAVKGEGRHFTFYINDQQVGEIEDIHFKEGQVALMGVMQQNDEGRIEFDNFEIRTPNQ